VCLDRMGDMARQEPTIANQEVFMKSLKDKLKEQIPSLREEARQITKNNATTVVSEVTIAQVYGGMRGVAGLVCDTSVVDPDRGLIVRGFPIGALSARLPEEILYLLLTGELPDEEALLSVQQDLRSRAKVPAYMWEVLRSMPKDSHPMAMLSAAILVMEHESAFRSRYAEGMRKEDYWEPALEDSLQIIAKLPAIAAGIYRIRCGKPLIDQDTSLDWASAYAQMLGLPDPKGEFTQLMRLYLTLHCDHEGGNVSAFTCHTVGSALADPYYALSAGLNGLAGPIHGGANQECLQYVLEVKRAFKGVPTDEQLKEYAWNTLKSGRVIPGYGHAVLRITDPRFTSFHEFGAKICPDDEVVRIVDRIYAIVPGILKEQGKAKDPWPNVDAVSGALLYHFGLTQFDYYTVLFGISRAMGLCSQVVIQRALGAPITRPKSVSTEWVKKAINKMKASA
jgi:citrate synthase